MNRDRVNRFRTFRVPVAATLAACCALAAGCSTIGSVAKDLTTSRPESTVPTRRAVAASSTPTPTASAAVASGPSAGRSTVGTLPGSIEGAFGDGSTGTVASAQRVSIVGATGDSRRFNDNGLSEGGGNLAQVSFATEGGDYAPDVDRTGSFLVFASTQHRPTFDIYRKTVDGRTVTQLTTDPSDDLMPSISPDGKQVAFSSNRNGNWDVYVMSINGGAPSQITSDADDEVQPTWAPDGKRIAFSRKNGRTGIWEIWIVDSSSPGLRTFVCEGFLPRWSPNPNRDTLLFQRARQRGTRLYGVWTIDIVQGEGMNPTEVVSAKNAAILQPNWSPDGAKIVFTTVVNPVGSSEWPDQSDIWVVSADGTGRIGLTNSRFRNMQPSWGSDGRIYFVSNRGGIENIWSIAADPSKIANNGVNVAANRGNRSYSMPAATTPKQSEPALASPSRLPPAGVDE
ncbi:MAG: TolB family protein [Planctomycetota bacterium]